VWGVAENSLNYINSLKMKISVIIGVVHMTLGVLVKATNSLYFKRKVEFWFEFLPQLLFLVLVFGYMDFLIIFKWLKDWGFDNPHAPSIITTMINLPLQMGKTVLIPITTGQRMLPRWLTNVGLHYSHFARRVSNVHPRNRIHKHPHHAFSQTPLLNKQTKKTF
jgi:vacuolar-type H+-ATPase subunit I/STV1